MMDGQKIPGRDHLKEEAVRNLLFFQTVFVNHEFERLVKLVSCKHDGCCLRWVRTAVIAPADL